MNNNHIKELSDTDGRGWGGIDHLHFHPFFFKLFFQKRSASVIPISYDF